MKKKSNLRGFWIIIALAAVIGLMAGCDNLTDPSEQDGPSGSNPEIPASLQGTTWRCTGIPDAFTPSADERVTVGNQLSFTDKTVTYMRVNQPSNTYTTYTLTRIREEDNGSTYLDFRSVTNYTTFTVSCTRELSPYAIYFQVWWYYGKWQKVTTEYCPINWNLNGGTAGTGAYPTQVIKGTLLTRPSPDPTKANSTFGGWYTDSGLTQAYNFSNPVTANLNLYAKWETGQTDPGGSSDITYIVIQIGGVDYETDSTGIEFTFDDDSVYNMDLTAADITVGGAATKDDEATLSGDGAYWILTPITVNSAGLATVSINKTGIEAGTKSVTVYKAEEYAPQYWSITWHLNGGTEGTGTYPTLIVKDEVLTKPSPDPTKDGNTFGGWYTNSALTQTYNFASPVTANLNLYAKWETESQPSEYWSITWNLNGGTADTGEYPEQIVKGEILAKPSPDPTKTDNTFGGWYADSGLTQAYNFANPVTADLNLYAKWEAFQPPAGTPVSGNTLTEKLQWVKDNAESNTAYTIEVSVDEAIDPHTLSYTSRSNITIILWGSGGEKIVSLSQNGSLFTIGTDVTLVLDRNITLQGRSNNTVLVSVSSGGELIMNTGAKIISNISSSYNGGGVHVNGGTFTMADGEISGNTSSYYGGGVYVESGTFTIEGGKISGNTVTSSGFGGGVYMTSNGTFTMTGGEISGNTGTGRGVYIASDGAFTMNGGKISGNGGGGVYIGEGGIFTMTGGEISNNTASSYYGGGVYMASNGTFMMEGGEISGNTISGNGGGVSIREGGAFTMTGGEISGNTANVVSGSISGSTGNGGGVYVESGTFTMNSGEISLNTCNSGGGVYVSGGTFMMESGKISDNTARASGGGVYVGSSVTFMMTGGEISNNTTSTGFDSNGGGVYVGSNGIFTMEGGKITHNITYTTGQSTTSISSYGGGVYVASSGTITMTGGEISDNIVRGYNNYSSGSAYSYGGGVYVGNNGIFTMEGGKITNNTASNTYSRTYCYGGGVYTASGVTFTMSGGEISGNTASASFESHGGGVYITSSSVIFIMSGGEISDNTASASSSSASSNSRGGGVYVGSSVTFTVNGGEISGNTASASSSFAPSGSATSYGGGVYAASGVTFTMSDGEISDNTASASSSASVSEASGGGVYGTLTMTNGTISGNTASYRGGGVYGTLTMSNGTISGNTAYLGGGVSGSLTMSGGTISGNTASASSNSIYGGGVYGSLTKTGGTIYGYSASDTINSNMVKHSSGLVLSNQGHAVYVNSSPAKRRETTAGPEVDLDSSQTGAAGGWEN